MLLPGALSFKLIPYPSNEMENQVYCTIFYISNSLTSRRKETVTENDKREIGHVRRKHASLSFVFPNNKWFPKLYSDQFKV